MKRSNDLYDLIIAPLCEAGLLLLAGAAAMLVHKPLRPSDHRWGAITTVATQIKVAAYQLQDRGC